MSARNVDCEGKEMRFLSGAAAQSPDPFRVSICASLPEPVRHCIHGCRLGDISMVSTDLAESRTLEEPNGCL